MIVLGIETSCDETAVALCHDGNILCSEISTQTIHRKFGGVVPEIASREHERLLNEMVNYTINNSGIEKSKIEGIAVTQGPGLSGTLISGVSFISSDLLSESFSFATGLPSRASLTAVA